MATEVLRPVGITNNLWIGNYTDVLDTLGAPNTADYVESPLYVGDQDYQSPVSFSFNNPTTNSVDILRVRTVVDRTDAGNLTFQVRVIVNGYPVQSPYVAENRTLSNTWVIAEDTVTAHEVIDVFPVDLSVFRQINSVKVEYQLSPSGVYDSITGLANPQVMTATNATLKLISVALEVDSYSAASPPGSPPTWTNFPKWDFCPAFVLASDNRREAILPTSFSPRSQQFTGHIQQLQDPLGLADIAAAGSVAATFDEVSTNQLVMLYPEPVLPYDGEGFINIRWRTSSDSSDIYLAVTLFSTYAGEKTWLGTALERNTSPGTWTSSSIAAPLLRQELDGLEIEVRLYGQEPGTAGNLQITGLFYAFAGFAPAFTLPPTPLLPPVSWVSPPAPPGSPPTLLELPGSPPIGGDPTPFYPSGTLTGCSPPSPPPPGAPVSSPLPPGSELLRPNRDIRSVLFNKKPLWLSLNDDTGTCETSIAAPAEVDVYDETTGDRLRSYRAQFEVGFTQPQLEGPWQSLQLRFQAARSRPPQEESFITASACQEVVEGTCPGPQLLSPNKTFSGSSWLPGPAHLAIDESPYYPDGCYIVHSIDDPSTLSIGFTPPTIDLSAIDGWTEFELTVRARLRALEFAQTGRVVSKLGGNVILFSGLTGFQVRFEPLNCFGSVSAFLTSSTRIEGMAVLRSNIDTELTIKLATPHHTIVPLMSLDGESYGVEHRVKLQSLVQKTVYYSIEINQNGDTPVGQYGIGLIMALDGDAYTTADQTFYDAVVFDVASQAIASGSALSVVRLKSNLEGEQFFGQRWQRSPLLKKTWVDYTFSFVGRPFMTHTVGDLKALLDVEVLYGANEKAVVDVDVISLKATPYCENITALPETETTLTEAVLIPVLDLENTGWSPAPLSPKLVSIPAKAERSIYVETNTLQSNHFTLAFDFEEPPDTTLSEKTYDELVIQVTARAYDSYDSLNTVLNLQPNYGAVQTVPLTNSWKVYEAVWTFDPPQSFALLTNRKLRLAVEAKTTGTLSIAARVQVGAVRVFARASDAEVVLAEINQDPGGGIPISSGTPASTLPALTTKCFVSALPSSVEAFSCGSQNAFGTRPNNPVLTFKVQNTSVNTSDDALVQVDIFGNVQYWVTPSVVEIVEEDSTTTFAVYLAVGSSEDPYPRDLETGLIRITVMCPGQADETRIVQWQYRGVD